MTFLITIIKNGHFCCRLKTITLYTHYTVYTCSVYILLVVYMQYILYIQNGANFSENPTLRFGHSFERVFGHSLVGGLLYAELLQK